MQGLDKQVNIKDRNFSLRKFDARTGSYIAFKIMAEVLPMGLNKQLDIPTPKGPTMSKADFFDIQDECLRVCFELLPSGPTPVLDPVGNYQIIDVANDAPLILFLTIQALMWNVQGFFDAGLLDSLSEAFQNMKLPDVKTLMNGSSPQ